MKKKNQNLINLAKGIRKAGLLSPQTHEIPLYPLFFYEKENTFFLNSVEICLFCSKSIKDIGVIFTDWQKTKTPPTFFSCVSCQKNIQKIQVGEMLEQRIYVVGHPPKTAYPVFVNFPGLKNHGRSSANVITKFDIDKIPSRNVTYNTSKHRFSFENAVIGDRSCIKQIEKPIEEKKAHILLEDLRTTLPVIQDKKIVRLEKQSVKQIENKAQKQALALLCGNSSMKNGLGGCPLLQKEVTAQPRFSLQEAHTHR